MTKIDDEDWDPDIASTQLSDIEKDGLQVYRNYTKAFERHAIKRFIEQIDAEPLNLQNIEKIINLIVQGGSCQSLSAPLSMIY